MPAKRRVSSTSLTPIIVLGLSSLALAACGDDAPTRPAVPSRIIAVTGSAQVGYAGSALPLPLVVRVDNGVTGVPNVPVDWRITSGTGDLLSVREGVSFTVTDTAGRASAFIRPTAPGAITVTVTTPAVPGAAATFTAFTQPVPGVVIRILPGFDCGDPSTFKGPDGSSDVTVPVGVVVEWVYAEAGGYWPCTADIQSTTVPPGGGAFGAMMVAQQRFQFVPTVAGTWEYADLINGGRATLTAVAP